MRLDARLAIPAGVAWLVVGVLVGMPAMLGPAAVALWGLSTLAVCIAMVGSRLRKALIALALVAAIAALVVSSAALANAQRHPVELVDAAATGRFVTATVVTNDVVHPGAQQSPLPVTITAVTVRGTAIGRLGIPAVLFGDLPPAGAGIGTVLVVPGTIVDAEAGSEATYLLFSRGRQSIVSGPPWYLDWANRMRSRFLAAATALPGDGGALLPGLATGDTSAVDHRLDAAMKATSLSHLTAVSGANCAVVIALIMLAGAAVGLSRRWRIGLSLCALVGFVILVTPEASVLRAGIMAALVLAMLASGRPARGLPILILAVIVMLFLDPWISRDYGFILSVLATGGLMLLSGPLAGLLARWLPAPIAAVISVPLAAQVVCQPVLIVLNPAVPVYGVVANLLSEPAAPVATVLGLIGCVLIGIPDLLGAFGILDSLGRVFVSIAWLPSFWIAAVAHFFHGLPGASIPWLPGVLGLGLMTLLVIVAGYVVLSPRRGRARRGALVLLLVVLVCWGSALIGSGITRLVSIPHHWQIAACDIGQGDAVLVRSGDAVALVDTGPDPDLLAKCLGELHVDRIQLLVLSHYDLDHVGGTAAVFGMVDQAIVGPVSDPSDTALRRSLQDAGAQVTEVSRGATGRLGELRWQVLWPPGRLGTVEPGNAASVTVRFEGVGDCAAGCLSALFTGDLGEEAQSRMLAIARPQPVDVVKVAHHGSADQSELLYLRLRAKVGIISVGADNDYGHPTDRMLDILNRAGTVVARTDRNGMVLLSAEPGGGVGVWTERPAGQDPGSD